MVSRVDLAIRALVKVLLALSRTYDIALTVTRDTPEDEILKAYRKVAKRVHPDKGGKAAHFRQLQTAKEEWDDVRKKAEPAGRRWPIVQFADESIVVGGKGGPGFRIHGSSVLLTYHGFKGLSCGKKFLKHSGKSTCIALQ